MNSYLRKGFWAVTLAIALATGAGADTAIEPLAGTNLALGKTATFSLEPNYRRCAGGDETDLFDGVFWQPGATGFWTDKGTVGWKFGRHGVLIAVDLGDVYAIDTIGFDTASGASQVTFPAALLVYVSDDGETWRYAADLIDEVIPQDQYVRHRFVVRGLQTRGRHVAVYLAKGGFYGFVDEIEVMEGAGDPSAVSFQGAGIARSEIESDALERAEGAVQKNIDLYFLQAARAQVASVEGGDTATVLRQLEALEKRVFDDGNTAEMDYLGGLPYTEVGRRICAAMGAYFSRGDGRAALLWQPTGSMWSHRTSPFARPAEAVAPDLHADMMIGEYEPVAFNVSNNTAEPMAIQVEVDEMRGAEGDLWPEAQIARYIATHVVGSGFLFFDDALPPLGDGGATIPPGMTRQVWLVLHARGVAPQQYEGRVVVAVGDATFELPLSATVYPVEMPADPTYTAQSWGYFTWTPSKGYEQQAAAELERCYANAHVLHHAYIPWPRVDEATGQLVRPVEVDFARLDEMLAYRPYVRQWLLWTGFEFGFLDLNYHRASDVPQVGTSFISFNNKNGVFSPKDNPDAHMLRTAAAHAIDHEGIHQAIFHGQSSSAIGFYSKHSPWYSDNIESWPEYDLDKAKSLLKKAKGGDAKITLVARDAYSYMHQSGEIVHSMLQEAGFNVTFEIHDYGVLNKKYKTGDFDMDSSANSYRLDPDIWYARAFLSTSSYNKKRFGYKNEKVDQIILAAKIEPDQKKRHQMYADVDSIVNKDVPILYSHYVPLIEAGAKNLQGYEPAFPGPFQYWGGGLRTAWMASTS